MSGSLTVNGNIATNAISCSTLTTNGNAITCWGMTCYGAIGGVSSITCNNHIALGQASDYGLIYWGNSGVRYLEQNGSEVNWLNVNVHFPQGNMTCGYNMASGTISTGAITSTTINTQGNRIDCGLVGCTGGVYCSSLYLPDGNNYHISDGTNLILRSTGGVFFQNTGGGNDRALYAGALTVYNGGASVNATGGAIQAAGYFWTSDRGYQPGGGAWSDTSDGRIKTVLGLYENGLDAILALEAGCAMCSGQREQAAAVELAR